MKDAPKRDDQPLHYTSRPTEEQIDQLWDYLRNNLWMAPLMNDTIKGQLEIIAQAKQEAGIGEDVLGQEIDAALDGYRWWSVSG
jgi:hypothetical protein